MLKIYLVDDHLIPVETDSDEALGLFFVGDAGDDEVGKLLGDKIVAWYRGE